jgi:hypothetical protein
MRRSPPPTQPTNLGYALGQREVSPAAATLTHAHAVALPMASGSSSSATGAGTPISPLSASLS